VGRGSAGFAEQEIAFIDALNRFYIYRKLCWFIKTLLGALCRVVRSDAYALCQVRNLVLVLVNIIIYF
jgi:hypothetical protein